MMLGVIIYMIAAQRFLGDIGKYPIYQQNKANKVENKPLTKVEKDRILVIFILLFSVQAMTFSKFLHVAAGIEKIFLLKKRMYCSLSLQLTLTMVA